jgi:hypothetical protein
VNGQRDLFGEPEEVQTEPVPPFEPSSETSTEAATEKDEDSRVTERRRVYEYIYDKGDYGATREEIEFGLSLSGNTVRPRVWELLGSGGRHKPAIFESSDRRPTTSGRRAAVLKAL